MELEVYRLRIEMVEPLLGTQPPKDVAEKYTQDKAREAGLDVEDELETLPEMLERGTTVFHKLDGQPIYYDYHIKGFLKEAGNVLKDELNIKALRSKIDNLVFVAPRQIPLLPPQNGHGGKIEFLERTLRAQTMQGPRVTLARSEMLPAGTGLECRLRVLHGPITEKVLREILSYGELKGLGQWRNGGFGRFSYDLVREE